MFFLFRWLNFLSIDALCVALLWQELFARTTALQLRWQERLVLGLSVWIVYLLDHVLDSFCMLPSRNTNNEPRHHFAQKHRIFLIAAIFLATLVDTITAFTLPYSILVAGTLLAIAATFYLGINTFLIRQGRWFRGREILIALFFAFGCGLIPLLKTDNPFWIVTSILFFAGLCALNCILIARMERSAPLATLHLLPEPIVTIGTISLFFLLSSTYWKVIPVEIAFSMSLFGFSLIPEIAKRYGYEIASLATDGALLLGGLLALLS